MTIVDLTADQSACIESLSDDCTVIGVRGGCPLVCHASGEVAVLESDGRLRPAGRYTEATVASPGSLDGVLT
jgi:hypothetical protein